MSLRKAAMPIQPTLTLFSAASTVGNGLIIRKTNPSSRPQQVGEAASAKRWGREGERERKKRERETSHS